MPPEPTRACHLAPGVGEGNRNKLRPPVLLHARDNAGDLMRKVTVRENGLCVTIYMYKTTVSNLFSLLSSVLTLAETGAPKLISTITLKNTLYH